MYNLLVSPPEDFLPPYLAKWVSDLGRTMFQYYLICLEILNLHESAGNQFQDPYPVVPYPHLSFINTFRPPLLCVGDVKRNMGRCYIFSGPVLSWVVLEGGPYDHLKIHWAQGPLRSSILLIARFHYPHQGLQEINTLTPSECGQVLHSSQLETDTASNNWAVAKEGWGAKPDGGLGFKL